MRTKEQYIVHLQIDCTTSATKIKRYGGLNGEDTK
jgi:hypothetical protein